MNGSYNMIHVIMEQHRYTVGRGDTNADSRLTGDECIHPVEERLAHTCIEIQHFRCHHPYLCMMDLMRHDEMLVINPQMVAKKNLVGFHILHPVTTIVVDVHRCVSPLALSAVPCGAERHESVVVGQIIQFNTILHEWIVMVINNCLSVNRVDVIYIACKDRKNFGRRQAFAPGFFIKPGFVDEFLKKMATFASNIQQS